jgi:hypothetical protein
MVPFMRWATRTIASLGCEGAMRAIASSISPHASPRQGPTPISCTATAECITTVQTYVSAAAKTLPTTPTRERQIAASASQLLKPASTTPRSYGRRHRSWHRDHAYATQSERRRGQRLNITIKYMRGARASAWAPRPSTCDASRAPLRTKA